YAEADGNGYTYLGICNPHKFTVELTRIDIYFSFPISFAPLPNDDLFQQCISDIADFRFRLETTRKILLSPNTQKILAFGTSIAPGIQSRNIRIGIISRSIHFSWDSFFTTSFRRRTLFSATVAPTFAQPPQIVTPVGYRAEFEQPIMRTSPRQLLSQA